ncbi:MAG: hypothetical protein V1749_11465 [Candidatus Desantisbacteria bacterium]
MVVGSGGFTRMRMAGRVYLKGQRRDYLGTYTVGSDLLGLKSQISYLPFLSSLISSQKLVDSTHVI